MKGKISCIALLLTMLITLTASATAYDATSVKMLTSEGDIDMVKIGTTADSCGIWVCRNIDKDATKVKWQIDSLVNLSYDIQTFETNTLYTLANPSSMSADRDVAGDTTVYVYLKVKDQQHAQCFFWDGHSVPSFISQFQIPSSVTANVTDGYYGDNCYIHLLKYQVSGVTWDALDHLSIDLSYDYGQTWTTYTTKATLMDATMPIKLSTDVRTVRYRFTAHIKNGYQAPLTDYTWICETSDYNINPAETPRYEASKVWMNTGMLAGWEVSYSHIGTAADGCQIWVAQGIDHYYNTYWKVDDGEKLSATIIRFRPYTIYHDLTNNYLVVSDKEDGAADRSIVEGTQWYHFVKVKSKAAISYFSWSPTEEGSNRFRPYSFYLYADFTLNGMEIVLNRNTHTLQRNMTYGVKHIDGEALDSIALYASTDQGKTWKKLSELTTGLSKGTKAFSKSELVDLPGNGTTIRYRVVAYANPIYKVLAENGQWVFETTDYPIQFTEVPATYSFTVDTISQRTYSNTEGTSRGTYRADISYQILSEVADQVDSLLIQCSNDHGKTWYTVDVFNSCQGETAVRVPAGYPSYQLRAVPFLKGDLANVTLLNQIVTATEQTLTYNPQVTSLTATKGQSVESCGKTLHTYTIRYKLNSDLYQTRRKASIAYSYDDGQHWYNLPSFEPNPSGEQTVTVDGSHEQCRFRINVGSTAYDNETSYSAETQNITFE